MEVAGYFGVIGRWWATLLISTWVAGLAGYFIASGIQPTYEGVARLLVGPVVADVDVTRASGALAYTYSELTTTAPALEEVRQTLGLPAETEIVARAIPNETTRILDIRAEASTPEVAAAIANALATNLQEAATADVVLPEGQLTVIDPATPNPDPIAPQVTLIAIVAAATGLIASAVLVVLVEYFGTTVNSQRELGDLTRAPVLGSVSLGRGFRRRPEQPTIVEAKPGSRATATLRAIGTKIAYTTADPSSGQFLVLGTAPGDGAADLALGLATVLARGGRRVVIIDADEESATLSEILAVDGMPGLTDLLHDPQRDPAQVLIPRPFGPSVIPFGTASTPEILEPEDVTSVVRRLQATHDLIIVTTAPIQFSGHALVWARAVAGVVLGVERERAKRDDVTYASENLTMLGANVIGTVFLGRAPRSQRRSSSTRRPSTNVPVATLQPPPRGAMASSPPPGRSPAGDRVSEARSSDKPPR